MKHRGFTLIELLVVIAIIAILAAILFPVFAQAREKARQTQCLSNQRQISTGLMMYISDYEEFYPPSQYGGGTTGIPQQAWYSLIWPYVKNGDRYRDQQGIEYSWGERGVYACPSHPDPNQSGKYGVHLDLFADQWNCCLPGQTPTNNAVPMAMVEAPTDKIILAEKGRNNATWGWVYFGTWEWDWTATVGNPRGSIDGSEIAITRDCDYTDTTNNPTWAGCGMMPRYRHNKTTDVIFGDGHAKVMAKGSIKWYRNIYIPVNAAGRWTAEGWYPY